jgi:AcrR family transcriptional regulator
MVDDPLAGDEPGAVVRRAPFSDNPQVGARGQRTQQRILDAALGVFADEGYHDASIDRITKRAGCSRVSFYQYFSSKEDVFGHLAGRMARQLGAATEALDPLTPDREGRRALRAWVSRYADTYDRYVPVFHGMQAAAESDESLAAGAARLEARVVAGIRSRLATATLPPRQLDSMIRLLLESLTHTLDDVAILGSAAPGAYPPERTEESFTDVMHRALFGLRPDVNVHTAGGAEPPRLQFSAAMWEIFRDENAPPGSGAPEPPTRAALLASGRDVFVKRGYHNTRVDDLVSAAGVSHGAFYRYFRNKSHLARILTVRAMRTVSTTLLEIPGVAGGDGAGDRAALRRWLRRYNATSAEEAAMIRVWVDASIHDADLRADSAPALDWGRRWMARFLGQRGFGDVDMDAVVMVAMLGVFGARPRPVSEVEAGALFVERGLLGQPSAAAVGEDGVVTPVRSY